MYRASGTGALKQSLISAGQDVVGSRRGGQPLTFARFPCIAGNICRVGGGPFLSVYTKMEFFFFHFFFLSFLYLIFLQVFRGRDRLLFFFFHYRPPLLSLS